MRAAGEQSVVLADGYSCRMQLADLSTRRGMHLAELFAAAVASAATTKEP